MKGSREHKRYIAKLRSWAAKVKRRKNGNIPSAWFDDLWLFRLEQDRRRELRAPSHDDIKEE